jgi:hypothetical protein
MSDFKVPTVQLATELHWADGVVLRGHVYMPALSAVHAGPMQPDEWINSPLAFFPFRAVDGKTLLANKRQVLAMTVEAPPAPDDGQEWEPAMPLRRVTVEAGGQRFQGDVAIDMPENQRRVVDYLNNPEAFLCLAAEGRHILVRKEFIARAYEAREP